MSSFLLINEGLLGELPKPYYKKVFTSKNMRWINLQVSGNDSNYDFYESEDAELMQPFILVSCPVR